MTILKTGNLIQYKYWGTTMKTMQKYILIGLVMILAACQNKDDYQYDKVQVYAGINEEASTRVSDDGAYFTNGDVIKVINTSRGTNNIAA